MTITDHRGTAVIVTGALLQAEKFYLVIRRLSGLIEHSKAAYLAGRLCDAVLTDDAAVVGHQAGKTLDLVLAFRLRNLDAGRRQSQRRYGSP